MTACAPMLSVPAPWVAPNPVPRIVIRSPLAPRVTLRGLMDVIAIPFLPGAPGAPPCYSALMCSRMETAARYVLPPVAGCGGSVTTGSQTM